MDTNTYFMDKHLEKQQKETDAFEMFLEGEEDEIGEIVELIKALKYRALNQIDYDFTENIEDFIKDLAWVFTGKN